jgi:DNA-binding LytR/AlgR family response regulator
VTTRLAAHPETEIAAECANGFEVLDLIEPRTPAAIFVTA